MGNYKHNFGWGGGGEYLGCDIFQKHTLVNLGVSTVLSLIVNMAKVAVKGREQLSNL